jgi:hypothetical protein
MIHKTELDKLPKNVHQYYLRKIAQVDRFREENRRRKLKRDLLQTAPVCGHCGIMLTDRDGKPNFAHLVIDRLACGEHVKIVRAYAYLESPDSIVVEAVR